MTGAIKYVVYEGLQTSRNQRQITMTTHAEPNFQSGLRGHASHF
jgi:hypothetical protein